MPSIDSDIRSDRIVKGKKSKNLSYNYEKYYLEVLNKGMRRSRYENELNPGQSTRWI